MTDSWMGRLAGGKFYLVLAASLVLALQVGCGDGTATSTTGVGELSPDQAAINSLVSGVSDMSSELSRLRESFTKDNAPKSSDKAKYAANYFEIEGDIVVSGTTANFPVKISSYTTEDTRQMQWKAEKVGDTWLLSDTPLP